MLETQPHILGAKNKENNSLVRFANTFCRWLKACWECFWKENTRIPRELQNSSFPVLLHHDVLVPEGLLLPSWGQDKPETPPKYLTGIREIQLTWVITYCFHEYTWTWTWEGKQSRDLLNEIWAPQDGLYYHVKYLFSCKLFFFIACFFKIYFRFILVNKWLL